MLNRMALEVNFYPLWHESLATLLPTAADNVATRLGGHAGTEPVLILTGALRRLISPFHRFVEYDSLISGERVPDVKASPEIKHSENCVPDERK